MDVSVFRGDSGGQWWQNAKKFNAIQGIQQIDELFWICDVYMYVAATAKEGVMLIDPKQMTSIKGASRAGKHAI